MTAKNAWQGGSALARETCGLSPQGRDPLSGEWSHFRDCHIEPDWLLIYKVDGDDLYLARTGTHSDLF